MDPSISKKTQNSLKKYIKKPPLSDKLLGKPPFRYLHDIITELIRTHSFFDGLYKDTELKAENVKDRDTKIEFLQKAIDVTSFTSGEDLSNVKPNKIVAGHEPEKTNEWLQAIGSSLKHNGSSSEAVRKVLNGEKPGAKSKSREEHKEKLPKPENHVKRNEEAHRVKESPGAKSSKRERSHKKREKEASPKRESLDNATEKTENAPENLNDHNSEIEVNKSPKPASKRSTRKDRDSNDLENNVNTSSAKDFSSKPQINGISADPSFDVTANEEDRPLSHSRPLASRPSTARPPPTRKKRPDDIGELSIPSVAGGINASGVIMDKGDNSDEDETFIVEDHVPEPELRLGSQDTTMEDEDHGGLVKKLLETKKELETTGSKSGVQQERPLISNAQRRKEREMVKREIDKLQSSIQMLCRSANPLGKTIDYLQEDVDSMLKELDFWSVENKQTMETLKHEEDVTNSAVEPLKIQLTQLDQDITQQLEVIAALKANILRNDEKADKMMSSISFASRA